MSDQLADKEAQRKRKFDPFWSGELDLVFKDAADDYDTANDFFSFGAWQRVRRRFVGGINLFDQAEVLDLCAGTNAVGIDLLTRNPSLSVTAVDRNEAMQGVGLKRAERRGFQISSLICDVHELPFEGPSFDLVTLEAATRHLQVGQVFAEAQRVLKPGGTFYHCDLVKPKNPLVAAAYYNYLRVMIPVTSFIFFRRKEFLGAKDSLSRFSNYFIEAIDEFYTADELTFVLENSGFSNVQSATFVGGTIAVHQAAKL